MANLKKYAVVFAIALVAIYVVNKVPAVGNYFK